MPTSVPKLALLWDESHLWGLLAWRGLCALGARPHLLRTTDVTAGALDRLQPRVLVVPGGWAGRKAQALGEAGRAAIRRYVKAGGTYLGFCGGAGLALHNQGPTAPLLGLCELRRKPASRRLPNCSGHVHCRLHVPQYPASEAVLPVWWPSQFDLADTTVHILATYQRPGPDFWVADLPLDDIAPDDLSAWEATYGINLHPRWLEGDPCILSAPFGAGSAILSYAHLETPNSPQANALLAALLDLPEAPIPPWDIRQVTPVWEDSALAQMLAAVQGLIALGERHFLLTWRTSWLLGWRRGIPASHITTLLAMLSTALSLPVSPSTRRWWHSQSPRCLELCQKLCEETARYLVQERRSMTQNPSSPECGGSARTSMRQRLFGPFPGYGGMYGQILQILDELLAKILPEATGLKV